MRVVGLFAGIGGLEHGFELGGHRSALLVEIEEDCRRILHTHHPSARILGDIASVQRLPPADIVVAGFPCQPYSQAGRTRGLSVGRSHLDHIFRLLDSRPTSPKHVLLENVPFLIHLDGGSALRWILRQLEKRGFRWAYRIVDAMAFGIPQRRRRWYLLASRALDPARVLLSGAKTPIVHREPRAHGFYWTEGSSGIGWTADGIPPLRVGSGFGAISAPAIWDHEGGFWIPDLRDAERLMGFPTEWTQPVGETPAAGRRRWAMLGNAVSVPVAHWIALRMEEPDGQVPDAALLRPGQPWPAAAFFDGVRRFVVPADDLPVSVPPRPILDFLKYSPTALSQRAARGFLRRYELGRLRQKPALVDDLTDYIRAQSKT